MSKSELACVYAALILADDDVPITGEKIETILKASGVEVEPYWPGLFAKALQNCNVKDLITKIGPGMGASIAQNDEKTSSTEQKDNKMDAKKDEADDSGSDSGSECCGGLFFD